MKILAQLLCGALLCLGAMAQDHVAHVQTHSVTLVTGLGDLHRPVSTHNPQAQQFFDQGMRFIYAFNHAEAARSFQHATELDPKLAMAYWGVAEAVGRTTTIRPIPIVTSMRMTPCRRRLIYRHQPRPASRLISRRWRSGFPQIRIPT